MTWVNPSGKPEIRESRCEVIILTMVGWCGSFGQSLEPLHVRGNPYGGDNVGRRNSCKMRDKVSDVIQSLALAVDRRT